MRTRVVQLWPALVVSIFSSSAIAAGMPSAVIAPHEFDLPLKFKPISEFVEYGYFNSDDRTYAVDGSTSKGPDGATYVGISKLAYLASLGDRLGYEIEALVPLTKVAGREPNDSGVGDPIFAPVLWFKPTDNTTIGADLLVQPAWGQSKFSAHNLVVTPTLFYDANVSHVNVDGDIGLSLPSSHGQAINDVKDPAETAFANVRVAYALTSKWSPYLSADWQYTGKARDGMDNAINNSRTREFAMGAGAMWIPFLASSLSMSYSHALSGANVVQTDAVYFRYVYSW